jgi:hypothetical protein
MTHSRHMLVAALIGVASGVATFGGSAAIAAGIDIAAHPLANACPAGTKLDNSTSEEARTKLVNDGYFEIGHVVKGCDNWWHAAAVRNGKDTFVLLSPGGTVFPLGK